MKNALRGLFYTRTSTSGQTLDESGNRKQDPSPDIHRERSIDHVRYLSKTSKKKYQINEFLIDEGYSGKDTNRPGFKKMCELIKSGELDFIVTVELSRLSRSVTDFLDLVALCEEHNVDLMIIGLNLDTSTAFGKAMVTILVTLAQFERETTSERVKANVTARLIATGKINGAAEILGLVRDPERPGHFIKDEEGLKTAIKIMNLFLKYSSKARVLQEAKRMELKGKDGQELTSRMIDYLLENSKWRYRGLWYANSENQDLDQESLSENQRYQVVKLDHGPLIDEKFLDEVSLKLDESKNRNKKCGLGGFIYQLSNLLFDEDGNPFKGGSSNGGKYRYYMNQVTKDRVRVDEIEPIVMDRLKQCLENRKIVDGLIEKGLRDRV